ncbi:MAG: hypothetical protein NXI24_16460 [bacterium]|nr:hypothetical protein [bacterium]
MNRLWILGNFVTIILATAVLTPAFAQTDASKGETKESTEESLSPGEEPGTMEKESSTTETATGDSSSASDVGGVLWTDPNGNIYANSKVKFILEARDDLSDIEYIEYRIDDANSFIKYKGPFTISQEGPHVIVYRSVDRAGNHEVDHVYNVTIDNKGPAVNVLPSKPFVNLNGKLYTAPGNTFTVRTIDALSGIKSVEYGVNTSALQGYSKNEAIQLTDSGSQLIQYKATDNLQNATSGSMLVQVDAGKPTVEISPSQPLISVDDKMYARRNTGFDVNAQDLGSGVTMVMVRIDGSEEWQTYTDTIYFDTEKEHSIEAKAIDAVGNESEIVTSTFIVDDNPPTTELKTSVE